MPLDEDKAWVLWPEYFDSSRTRAAGRKVSKELAVKDPTLEMIVAALKNLGLDYKVEEDKAFPGNWHAHLGRILVSHSMPKTLLLLKVSQYMVRHQRS
jgi:signal recognition particle subunit SRP19